MVTYRISVWVYCKYFVLLFSVLESITRYAINIHAAVKLTIFSSPYPVYFKWPVVVQSHNN